MDTKIDIKQAADPKPHCGRWLEQEPPRPQVTDTQRRQMAELRREQTAVVDALKPGGFKMPPMEKIYEAWTAVTDGRVHIASHAADMSRGTATVDSSDGARRYTIAWSGDEFNSDDPMSYWQHTVGYPVIALLMTLGRIGCDTAVAADFSGIDWNALNKAHRGDYAAAAAEVILDRGLDADRVGTAADNAYARLRELPLRLTRKKLDVG